MTDECEKDNLTVGKTKGGKLAGYLIGPGDFVLNEIKDLGKPEEKLADIFRKHLKPQIKKTKSDKKR